MAADDPILHVGDKVLVMGIGRAKVERIDVCLRPSTDPAAERHFASVDAIELGEAGPPFAVHLEGGTWAYASQIIPADIEEGEGHAES